MSKKLQEWINKAWDNQNLLKDHGIQDAIREVIEMLDNGKVRVSEPIYNSRNEIDRWQLNEWIKKAVLMYFPIQGLKKIEMGVFEFYDKIGLKKNFKELGVRIVPHALARYGAYLAKGVIMMPSYVNIGAYVDSGTMIDTWATVGSCAQIGKNVHISGGVGIGGVLEPIQASPVIIEDDCFIGSRCVIVEGVHVKKQAVLGANVVITNSTKIIDVTGPKPVEIRGVVPEFSVVIPGSVPKKFTAGLYHIPCAIIIGKRKKSTNLKTSLNEALREYSIAV